MTDNKFPEINGSVISKREHGWKIELNKAMDYLLVENPDILLEECRHVPWWDKLSEDEQKNWVESFRSFIIEYWKIYFDIIPKKDEKDKIFMPEYDSTKGEFIQYLLDSIKTSLLASYLYKTVDGVTIINHGPGCEIEWAKVQHYLFDLKPGYFSDRCNEVLIRFSWLMNFEGRVPEYLTFDFKSFLLIHWGKKYGIVSDDQDDAGAKPKKRPDKESKFDPHEGTFVNYLIGSISNCRLAYNFIRDETSLANNFYQKKKDRIRREGRDKNLSQEEIEKRIRDLNGKIWSLSELDINNNDKEDNSLGSEVLVAKKDLQNRNFHALEVIIKRFIDYLNDECIDKKESDTIDNDFLLAGVQLYPYIMDVDLQDEDAWIYSSQKKPICKQKGCQWIVQKMLRIIGENFPGQKPEIVLYNLFNERLLEFNEKLSKPDDSKKSDKSEKSSETDEIKKRWGKLETFEEYFENIKESTKQEFDMYFVPLKIDDIQSLFAIENTPAAGQQRRRYREFVADWLFKNRVVFEAEGINVNSAIIEEILNSEIAVS